MEKENGTVETSSKNLRIISEIGREITSTLDLEKILIKIYNRVNELLDAWSFGIGLYCPEKECIEYKLAVENGVQYEAYTRDMKDKNQFPVWCIENKQPVFLNDVYSEYGKYIKSFGDDERGIKLKDGTDAQRAASMIYLPMMIKDKVIGILAVQSIRKNAYTENDIELLSNIASYAAIALENSRLYHNVEQEIKVRTKQVVEQKEELEKNVHNVKTLSKIGREITSTLDLEKVLFTIYQHVNQLMDANIFGIGLYNHEKLQIEYKLAIAHKVKYKPYYRDASDKNQFPVWCIENKKSLLINNVYEEYSNYISSYTSSYNELEDGTIADEVFSLIYLPILIKDNVVGIMSVQSSVKNAYKQHHVEILESIASYAAIALHNAQLYEHMEEDVKTRTLEVTHQKEEIEKTYQNIKALSEIGQKITATLSVAEIIEKVYENVNSLMDASVFAIGLLNIKTNTIDFHNPIEKGIKMPFFPLPLSNTNTFPVYCLTHSEKMFVSDIQEGFMKYFGEKKVTAISGEASQSLIYLPLIAKGKTIGVITVQSFRKQAYSQFHFNILQNLAIYSSIAIENARLYQNMEDEVKDRTKEVVYQKEELEKNFQNVKTLNKIGREITSTLDLEKVLFTIHEQVNKLMDASSFGIGLYYPEKQRIEYKLAIANNIKFKPYFRNTSDKNQFPVWCIENKKNILINDIYEEYSQYITSYTRPEYELEDGTKEEEILSLIYSPVIIKNEVLGIISVQSIRKNAYTPYHVEILETIASYAAIALHNARLYEHMEDEVKSRTREVISQKEEIEKTYDNNRLLSEIGQQITSSLNFEEIFSKLYHYVGKLMDVGCFGVRIYHPDQNEVEYKYEIEKGIRDQQSVFVSMDDIDNYSVWCIRNRKEIFINDNLAEYKKYTNQIKIVLGEMTHSLIFYPIIIGEKIIGVITIQSFEKNAYTQYHLDILKTLASYAAIALENANLYENLEEKVKERTKEVVQQKEEIDHAFQNIKLLSEIGQQITSSLNIETIFDNLHKNINEFMDAAAFGIRIYHPEKNTIEYKYEIENNKRGPVIEVSMEDDNNYSVWCIRNKKEIFINDNTNEFHHYIKSTYAAYGEIPVSLIFYPLLVNEKILGVVTVQSFKKGAYSPYHLNIIKTLASYTAIALDNARAYQDLNTALIRLQSTPQLVQAEKMASLGQLTAGIAHEINNPVNFISANINPLKRDLDDVLNLLTKYATIKNENDFKDQYETLERLKKEIDLEYLIDEIKSLLTGIEEGTKRTTEIVKGLRNFSRLDENAKKKASIHEGLDNTLTLLKNKYKDRIEVFKTYGDIPDIECYPGQLNQVFMNILSNSIQAIEGKGAVWISTMMLDKDNILIKIKDSGVGMSEEVKNKIFDPFFTTKDVGVGTGLGLSITYGIIEKHQGKIEVNTQVGKGAEFVITLPVNAG